MEGKRGVRLSGAAQLRQLPSAQRALVLAVWLSLSWLLHSSFGGWLPLQPVSLSLQAEWGMVAVRYLLVDGKILPPTVYEGDFLTWQPQQTRWVADGSAAGALTWRGLAAREVKLQLETGPTAGVARLSVNGQERRLDLQAQAAGETSLAWAPMASPATRWLDGIAALLLAGAILVLLLTVFAVAAGPRKTSRQDRRWTGWFVGGFLAGALLLLGFNYSLDPLQFYRRAEFPRWNSDQRHQNPGLARNYSYDTVLLGTSSVENYIPSVLNARYGWRTVKLAISGSSIHEQRQILDVAVRSGQVHRVIWALDFMALGGAPDRREDYFSPYPAYLYNENPLDDLQYLFSSTTTADSAAVLLHRLGLRAWHAPSLQLLNNWQTKYVFGEAQLWNSYQRILAGDFGQARLEVLYRPGRYTLQQFQENFRANILPVLRSQPQIRFHLFLPPYSIPFYHIYWQQDRQVILDWLAFRQWLAAEIAVLPNASLHDFQAEERYVMDYRRYKDFLHYDAGVGSEILAKMQSENREYSARSMREANRNIYRMIASLQAKK